MDEEEHTEMIIKSKIQVQMTTVMGEGGFATFPVKLDMYRRAVIWLGVKAAKLQLQRLLLWSDGFIS